MLQTPCVRLLLLLTGIFGGFLSGQVSLNVKVKPEAAALKNWLGSHPGSVSQTDQQELRSQLTFPGQLATIQPLRSGFDPRAENPVFSLFTLGLDSVSAMTALNTLNQSGQFEWVEVNQERKLHGGEAVPNDPDWEEQWFHDYIRTAEAWNITRGDASVVIGVLDTGLDYDHPEFEDQLWINGPEDLNGNGRFEPWPNTEIKGGLSGDFDGIDNDGNGFADDVIGYDFTDQPRSPFGGDYLFPDPDPLDDNEHGTLVAGIIGAKEDNNFGGAGIAPACKLQTLRAFAGNGSGEDDDIARAIIYAADNDVDVLNFSFGDIYPSLMMHEAIRYADAKGVVMVASAGNGTGDEVHYPSNFNEVISVSATALGNGNNEILWPLSSYGLTVSLAAPGNDIFTTTLRDSAENISFGNFSGTSTAAPMVAAAAGLLLAQRGTCTAQQIRGILTTSADDVTMSGWDHLTGAGRLNIEKALQTAGASHVQILHPLNDRGTAANTVPIVGTALHPEFIEWSLEWQAGTEGFGDWNPILTSETLQVHQDTFAIWQVGGLAEGEYTLRLRADLSNGRTAEDRIRFVRDTSAPKVEIKLAGTAWDNNERKALIVYRNSDKGFSRLHFRPVGGSTWQEMTFDRTTRNGEFLIGKETWNTGDYEFFVECTNESGLTGSSAIDTFSFSPAFAPLGGVNELSYGVPMGAMLRESYDFDGDGQREVLMSEYRNGFAFGKIKTYEYNGGFFSAVDSLDLRSVLIPKDVQDADGDGLLELLCSVNDTMFIVEQAQPNTFPKQEIFTEAGESRFAARFGDTDGDGQFELLSKDFQDYFVHERSGQNWSVAATLPDNSPDYEGSVAPRALVDDFDNDGRPETVFGDYDGDLLIHEHVAANNYNRTFLDTTKLERSGAYLESGDFDNDGIPEIFVAAHTSFLRNADFEYETPYWLLRIFEAVGDNQYTVVWQERLYDVDTDDLNAVTAGNLDQEAGEEIIFTTFPRTYMIDHDGSDYRFSWFHYGALCTDHVIGDFNGNGVNEFALGLGDTAVFYEVDFTFTGPGEAAWLWGEVNGPDEIGLNWVAGANATEYLIYRGLYIPGGTTVSLIDSTAGFTYTDTALVSGTEYLYVILAKNDLLSPSLAASFSNPVILQPHAPFLVDSLRAISDRQVQIWFDQPVSDEAENKPYFLLNGSEYPSSLVSEGGAEKSLILGYEEVFQEGLNTLDLSPDLRDELEGSPNPGTLAQSFLWAPDSSQYLYLTRWEVLSDKEAVLYFNAPTDASALDAGNYAVSPLGSVAAVSWQGNDQMAVIVQVDEVNFGALGYPLTITVSNVSGPDGREILEKEGNVATFSSFKEGLSGVYAYPNPIRPQEVFGGVRFANLTRNALITIFTPAGRKVIALTESDGDGGLTWNLLDEGGNPVKPGVFVYRVEDLDSEETFVGKFALLER